MPLQEDFEKQGNFLFKYRGTLPLIILVIGIAVFADYQIFNVENENYFLKYYYDYICLLVSFLGLFIRIFTVGYTPKNTSGRNTERQVADELNTTGIYSLLRHPLYIGNFFMWFGISLITKNIWFVCSFILFYWIYYERIMYAEEQFLRKKFGDVYVNWANKTNVLFPNFKNWQKPTLNFSIKKVLKKEKNGVLAIFIIFLFFKILSFILQNKNFDLNLFLKLEIFWVVATILSLIIYLILKFLKYKTNILNEEGR